MPAVCMGRWSPASSVFIRLPFKQLHKRDHINKQINTDKMQPFILINLKLSYHVCLILDNILVFHTKKTFLILVVIFFIMSKHLSVEIPGSLKLLGSFLFFCLTLCKNKLRSQSIFEGALYMSMHSTEKWKNRTRIQKWVFVSDTCGSWNLGLKFKIKLTFKLQRQTDIHSHSIEATSVVIEEEQGNADVKARWAIGIRQATYWKKTTGSSL